VQQIFAKILIDLRSLFKMSLSFHCSFEQELEGIRITRIVHRAFGYTSIALVLDETASVIYCLFSNTVESDRRVSMTTSRIKSVQTSKPLIINCLTSVHCRVRFVGMNSEYHGDFEVQAFDLHV
jgi:hypothetical protein